MPNNYNKFIYFRLVFVIFILTNIPFASPLSGQTNVIDSLQTLLKKRTESDTLKVNLLNEIASKTFRYSLEDARKYAEEAKELADELYYIKGQAESRKNIAFYYINKADYAKSLTNYSEAYELYQKIDDKNRMALCMNNIGIIYKYQGKFNQAIEAYIEALNIRTQAGDKYGVSSTLTNIGVNYYSKGDFTNALEFYQKALKINYEINDSNLIQITLNNIGVIIQNQGDLLHALEYFNNSLAICEKLNDQEELAKAVENIGVVYFLMKDFPKSLEYYQKALALRQERGNKAATGNLLNNIGNLFQQQSEYSKALDYYQQAIELGEEIGYIKVSVKSYYNIGTLFVDQKEFLKSSEYFEKALKIATEIDLKEEICENTNMLGFINYKLSNLNKAFSYSKKALQMANEIGSAKLQKECYDVLSQSSAGLGLYKDAYKYQVKFKMLTDSLLNESNIKEITNLQNQFLFEKEKEVITLEQQKKEVILKEEARHQKLLRNTFIIGFTIVLILGLIILHFYRKTKKINQKLIEQNAIILKQKEEKELLVKEIHHRVKNNLQIISSLFDLQLRNTDNPDTKSTLIDGLNRVKSVGLIHQLLYQSDDIIFIDFEDFVKKLLDHIISFATDKPIHQTIQIPPGLNFDIATTLPLGLIITELLTNAFKYAFDKVERCSVSVKLEAINENQYKLEISDNGGGLLEEFDFDSSKSLGLRLVRTLSSQLSGKIEYKYDKGAKFVLIFLKRAPHD